MQVKLEDTIAMCISAGYPEFLCRLEVRMGFLESWLGKVEMLVLDHSEDLSLGKLFQMGSYFIHGLIVRTPLVPLPKIWHFEKLFACWRQLIGKLILGFLQINGFITSKLWLESAPPCLLYLGGAKWQNE